MRKSSLEIVCGKTKEKDGCIHSCKLPWGHKGKHRCLNVPEVGTVCNYAWR